MRIAAVVLAAGRSERMGRPKPLLPCCGTTFLGTVLDTLKASRVDDVRVVLGHRAEEIRVALLLPEEIYVVNPRYDAGMLSSVQTGIRALPADTAAFLLWPVDHPLVLADTVERIVEAFTSGGRGVVLPVHEGRRGHPVLFAARLAPALMAAPESVGARAVARAHAHEVLELPVDDAGVVTDINTPEAYREVFGL